MKEEAADPGMRSYLLARDEVGSRQETTIVCYVPISSIILYLYHARYPALVPSRWRLLSFHSWVTGKQIAEKRLIESFEE